MLGAIIGDVIGSTREFNDLYGIPKIGKDFPLVEDKSEFTDDTVLTVALMDWVLHAYKKDATSVTEYFQKWGRKYPGAGFGGRFANWLMDEHPKPYDSYGNGSGMRISPIAYIASSKEELLELTDLVTGVTHGHPEGIKGARSIALAIFMALHDSSKEEIREMAVSIYPEIATFDYDDLVKNYRFNEHSQTTCPQALYCFLISTSFEDCIRTSASIGGDMDTLLAMSVAIAEAYYKDIPNQIISDVWEKLDVPVQSIVTEFTSKYDVNNLYKLPKIEPHYNLARFVAAQKVAYKAAKKELSNAKKLSHWMWYIFPQIKGLGYSSTSYEFGLSGLDEAKKYYEHEILGPRLVELCNILLNLETNDAKEIFGPIDDMKLRSSMTIFDLATNKKIFKDVLDKFFDGELDNRTIKILERIARDNIDLSKQHHI